MATLSSDAFDREALAKVALKTYNEWANLSPLKQMSFGYPSLGELIADAVIAHLSALPSAHDAAILAAKAEGWDEGFEIGRDRGADYGARMAEAHHGTLPWAPEFEDVENPHRAPIQQTEGK